MSKYFINCTNHPSKSWSEAQTKAALNLGDEIIDVPFPNVPADAMYDEVYKIADELRMKLFNLAGADKSVVLLQGETTVLSILAETSGYARSHDLSVSYVAAGQKLQCVTACSERRCIENADGTRTYGFEFVQFRETFELY